MKSYLKIGTLFVYLFVSITIQAGVFDNLQPVRIVTGLQVTEGPTWHPNGYLVFSDINGNILYKWSETAGLQTLVAQAGNPNGTMVTKRNEILICRQGTRDVAKIDTLGRITSMMSTWDGKRLNAPNDIALSYLGSVYFTDPDFGVTGRELTFQGLYCIPYNATNAPVLLDSTLVKPNGLCFAHDWKTLFVCESSTNNIYTYNIQTETKVDLTKDKKLFVKVAGTGEVDGITSDVFGNIYVAFGDGGVKIYDRSATLIGSITLPAGERVRNLCFGGKYNNLLFITAGTSVYKVDIRFYGDLIAPGLLGVPTDKSVIFNALSDKTMDVYLAYGTSENALNQQTTTSTFGAEQPIEITIAGLTSNTRYYYQLYYRLSGQTGFSTATKGKFMTQRSPGQTFSFAVEADPHLDENSNYYTFRATLRNMLTSSPDFMIDLGDNFMTEKWPLVNSYYIEQHNLLYRNFWDEVCSSMPLYIVVGNHEGELKWLDTNQANSAFNMTTNIRKMYYPNPQPDTFYTGNESNDLFVGKRENYYAWNWGDALFVVIDPYVCTTVKPTEPWGFTLGKNQYDWFRKTLEESKAKFKFVFSHQIVGGDYLGRGGADRADLCEMGGKNVDGSYGFDTQRPGWGKPLHQIMVENGVQIFFHGHDHFYAEQVKDGLIYQEVPQPSYPNYTVVNDAVTYGYVSGVILPNSGHLNVTVMNDSARVEYIAGYHVNNVSKGQINGSVRQSYVVKAHTSVNPVGQLRDVKPLTVYQSGNKVYICSDSNKTIQSVIYSLTGGVVQTFKSGVIQRGTTIVELPDSLANGVYILSFNFESTFLNAKIIKGL